MKLFDWLLGKTPESKPVEDIELQPKVIDIKVWVDLNAGLYSIKKFGCDGYVIPNVRSPFDVCRYVDRWLISRHIGDGYNLKATEFIRSCVETKTTSSKMYYGYEIKVTIMNDPQTHTKEN